MTENGHIKLTCWKPVTRLLPSGGRALFNDLILFAEATQIIFYNTPKKMTTMPRSEVVSWALTTLPASSKSQKTPPYPPLSRPNRSSVYLAAGDDCLSLHQGRWTWLVQRTQYRLALIKDRLTSYGSSLMSATVEDSYFWRIWEFRSLWASWVCVT